MSKHSVQSRKFLKTSTIYFLGNILTKIISFFLIPLYTAALKESEFGYFDTVYAILALIAPLVVVEIWTAILRFALDYEASDLRGKYTVIGNGMAVALKGSLLYLLVTGLVLYFSDYPYSKWIYIAGFFLIWQNICGGIARSLEKNVLYMLSGIIGSFVNLGLNYFLIQYAKLGLASLFIGLAAGSIAQVLTVFIGVRLPIRIVSSYKDFELRKSMLKFSWPLCINSLSYWFLNNYNRLAINSVLGADAVGIFGLAARFGSIMVFVTSVFNLAWQEIAFRSGRDENRKEAYTAGFNLYLHILCFGVLLLLPLLAFVFPLLVKGKGYMSALGLLPMYFFSAVFSTLSAFLGSIFGAEKKTRFIFVTTLLGSFFNILFLHLAMPVVGILAAPIALLLGHGLTVVLRLIYLKRQELIYFNIKAMIAYTLAFILLNALFKQDNRLYLLMFAGCVILVGSFVFVSYIKRIRGKGKDIE